MISPQDMTNAFARNVGVLKMQTEGLSHEESLLQLPFQGNCLNWVLGHIAGNRDDVLAILGEQPVMGDARRPYKTESEPLDPTGAATMRMEELLARIDRSQERIASALSHMTEQDLSREVTHRDRKTTLGARIFFYYFHETYHTGQTELLRQLTGKNDKVI